MKYRPPLIGGRGTTHRPPPRRGHRYRSSAVGARRGSEDAVTPTRRRFAPMTPIERLPGAAAFAVVVPQIDAPRIGLRGCATAAKRQGHALFEAKVLLFVKPWRRGAVIGEHLVISVEVTSE